MLIDIINNLTKEQRIELFAKGITSPLMSNWRTGKRRPTYAQVASLAAITGADYKKLLLEVAMDEALPEDKEALKDQANI